MRGFVLALALTGCHVHTNFGLEPSDRPIDVDYQLGKPVSREVCQRFVLGIQIDPPYSVGQILNELAVPGPLVRVVVDESRYWIPAFYQRDCVVVSGVTITPQSPAAPAVAAAKPPPPAPISSASASATPNATPPTPVAAAPPAPAPPTAPATKQVDVTVNSLIGSDGASGSAALRTALDAAEDRLRDCVSSSTTPVVLTLVLRSNGSPDDLTAVSGDASASQCVLGVVRGTAAGKIPWATKVRVEVASR